MKRKIILEYSPEDKCYMASIPSLPGCVADGLCYHTALHEVIAVAKGWIELAERKGWEIPPEDTCVECEVSCDGVRGKGEE